MKYVLLTLLIELLSMANSVAQIQLFEQYDVSYLNIMTGLPNNFVNDIFMDSRGFVWIATQSGGLVRYDGYNCYFGTKIQGLSLRSNSCRNLTEDRFHRLWVSFDEGTSIVDLDMMRQVMPKVKPGILDLNKIISERSVRVMTDSKGCIWLVTMGYIYRIAFNNQGEVVQILSFSYKANTPDVIITDIDQDEIEKMALEFLPSLTDPEIQYLQLPIDGCYNEGMYGDEWSMRINWNAIVPYVQEFFYGTTTDFDEVPIPRYAPDLDDCYTDIPLEDLVH